MSPIALVLEAGLRQGMGSSLQESPHSLKPLSSVPQEQRWTPMYCSLAAACLKSPLIEKPGGEVRLLSHLVECHNLSKMAYLSFRLERSGELIQSIS